MATKKYLTYDGLTEYDGLIKDVITKGDNSVKSYVDTEVAKKANSSHTHDDRYYTESEIDTKISGINTSITNITNGSVVVKEAEHATSADSASTATTAGSATKATQDASGNVITSTYETKSDASAKLAEAKTYADSAASKVKDDLLNGAGAAYDTLKELGDLIDVNVDAIDALETVASGKADKEHTHAISEVTNLQTTLDEISEKANESDVLIAHIGGNNVNGYTSDKTFEQIKEAYDNNKYVYAITVSGRKMELTSVNETKAWFSSNTLTNLIKYTLTITSENVVDFTSKSAVASQYMYGGVIAAAKSSTDTVEAKIGTDGKLYVPTYPSLDEYYTESEVDTKLSGKADKTHSHAISEVTGLQSALDGKADSSHGTHVTYDSTNKPKMDGTAAFGTSTKVARADHVHPTDTSRASKAEFDAHVATHAPSNAQANVIESIKVNGTALTPTSKAVNITVPTNNNQLTNGAGYLVASDIAGKADKSDTYTKAEVDAKTAVDTALSSTSTKPVQNKIVNSAIVTATNAITANTNSITAHNTRIGNLETSVGEFTAITSTEIQNLFK